MAQECRRVRSGDGRREQGAGSREQGVVSTAAKLRQSKGDA